VLLHTTFWIVSAGTHLTLFPILVVQSFGLSLSQVGSLFAVYSITNALVSQPSAMWSDRMGRKMAIIPGTLNSFGVFFVVVSYVSPLGGLILALTVGLLPWCVSSYQGLLLISFTWGFGASLMGTAPTV
jgi:MFS family permease